MRPNTFQAHLSRRELMRIGGLAVAGLSLAPLLRYEARAASKARGRIKAVILLQHYGAPSHIDLWDPKPNAPAEIRGEFKTIATSLPGYQVSEVMPGIARICRQLCIIRSMTHRVANHNPATYLALTGHAPERDIVQVPASPHDWPAFGSSLMRFRPQKGQVPSFVQIPHVAFDQVYKCPGQWAGMLGKKYDPLIVIGDPSNSAFRADELSLPGDMNPARLGDRQALLKTLDKAARQRDANPAMGGVDAFYERAFSILTSPEAKRAFNLSAEPIKLRDRYGNNKVGQCYLLARRLVEAGVRFVTCFNGQSPGDGWDTHADNFALLKNKLMPPDDLAFTALLEDLEVRGLLDSTLVIWAGEFGRKPEIGKAGATFVGQAGRDHWPQCYTTVLAGGGIKPGFLYGSSDRFAAYPQDKPVNPADFAATLYQALGIDPQSEMQDAQGRPVSLTSGTPIPELFG